MKFLIIKMNYKKLKSLNYIVTPFELKFLNDNDVYNFLYQYSKSLSRKDK